MSQMFWGKLARAEHATTPLRSLEFQLVPNKIELHMSLVEHRLPILEELSLTIF